MSILKSLLGLMPGGKKLARKISYYRRGRKMSKTGDTEDRFTHIYEHNKWQDPESVSGAGSSVGVTGKIRAELPRLLEGFAVARMLDAPCGDYDWFRLVERGQVEYMCRDCLCASFV